MSRKNDLITQAKSWLGLKESDNSYLEILNVYNAHKPLARNYAIKPSDPWCATFASAVAIATNCTDIVPTEVSCYFMVEGFKKLGEWIEDESVKPQIGDYIFYDWDDTGIGDNRGVPDHVGIVVSVTDYTITVIEGNRNDSVAYRTIEVNGKYIRGFGRPKYDDKPSESSKEEQSNNDYAQFFDKGKAGHYRCDCDLWLKRGANKNKPGIVVMPEGSIVTCYGYYSMDGSNPWLYATVTLNKRLYTGFCSSKYLTRI